MGTRENIPSERVASGRQECLDFRCRLRLREIDTFLLPAQICKPGRYRYQSGPGSPCASGNAGCGAGQCAEHLERKPESYDLITGYDIVEHFHKDEVLRFLDGCHSALKPGGRLILQTPNADSPWGIGYIYGDFTHEVAFNPNALSRLLRLAGFCRIEAREAGPVPWGSSAKSTLRYFIWQIIRVGLLSWNLAETGAKGSGILTRVFLISAVKGTEERLPAK